MKYYRIPNTDMHVSRLAYGTWHLGGSWDQNPPTESDANRAERLLLTAVDHGINLIDLADIYSMGKSDMVVGDALRKNPSLRERVYLQEKCGIVLEADPDRGGPGRYDFSYTHIVSAVETSLKRLHTEYVDLLALHRPDPLIDLEEIARAFDHLHRTGKVRYFGVSNHTAMQMALLQKHIDQPLVVNQVELSLMHHHLINDGIVANMRGVPYAAAGGIIDYCRLNDILIQAWSPVAGGVIFSPGSDAPPHMHALADLLTELAAKYSVSPEAIALAWLLRHPAGIQPIIGTQRPDRLIRSCQADVVELTRKEWYALFIAARGAGVP